MRHTTILTLATIATAVLFAPSANAETYSEHYVQAIHRHVTAMASPLEIETRKGFWRKMKSTQTNSKATPRCNKSSWTLASINSSKTGHGDMTERKLFIARSEMMPTIVIRVLRAYFRVPLPL